MTTTPEDPQNVTPEPGPAVPPPPAPAPPPAYGAAPPPAYAAGPVQPLSDSDARMWAMLAHIGGILFSFVAPLVVWAIFKERSRFVEEQSKEALNFQITLVIAYIVGSILTVILIGVIILFAAWIAAIVFGIIGGMAANRGEPYRYPFAIRLIK